MAAGHAAIVRMDLSHDHRRGEEREAGGVAGWDVETAGGGMADPAAWTDRHASLGGLSPDVPAPGGGGGPTPPDGAILGG
jgi:hypothetical protein